MAVDRFVGKGGHFVRGYARITAPDDRRGQRRHLSWPHAGVVIATGTLAAVPPIPGLADTPYWTNHDIMQAKELPESMIVLGGGAIGTELAQVMAPFRGQRDRGRGRGTICCPAHEPEVGELLADVFARRRDRRYAPGSSSNGSTFADEQFT